MAMNRNPRYTIEGIHADTGALIIRDIGPWDRHLSVTNGAEIVVEQLLKDGFLKADQRLFYYDTDNAMDELLIRDGKFDGFAPGPGGDWRYG